MRQTNQKFMPKVRRLITKSRFPSHYRRPLSQNEGSYCLLSLLGDLGPKDGLGRAPLDIDVDVFTDANAGDGAEDCWQSDHPQWAGGRR